MIARALQNRLKSLTDALLEQEDLDAAFLASVLLAAQDSIQNDDLAAFALRVWKANHPEATETAEPAAPPREAAKSARRRKVG